MGAAEAESFCFFFQRHEVAARQDLPFGRFVTAMLRKAASNWAAVMVTGASAQAALRAWFIAPTMSACVTGRAGQTRSNFAVL